MRYCHQCTTGVAISTCCSLTLISSTKEWSCEGPGQGRQLFNVLHLQGRYAKNPLEPFWIFEVPSLILFQGCMEPRGQSQWGPFATPSQLDSLQPPIQLPAGNPLSLQKYKWVLPLYSLMPLRYTLHWCLLEPYSLVDLMCQAIKSTQSNKAGCPST